MKKFYLMLVATLVACFAMTTNAATVYFQNTANWSQVAAYMWEGTGANSWPGTVVTTTITADNAVTYYKVDTQCAKIIFNNNGGGQQTKDLAVIDGAVYSYAANTNSGGTIDPIGSIKDGKFTAAGEVELTEGHLYFPVSTYNKSQAYLYTWGPQVTEAWPGTKMTKQTISGNEFWVFTTKDDRDLNGTTFTGVQLNTGDSSNQVEKTGVAVNSDYYVNIITGETGPIASYKPGGDVTLPDWYGGYVNFLFANNNWEDNGVQMTDINNPVAKFAGCNIGTGEFTVKFWSSATGDVFYSNGEAIAAGTAVEIPVQEYGLNMTAAGATADAVYDVEFNIDTKELTLTLVSGGVVTPTVKVMWAEADEDEVGETTAMLYVVPSFSDVPADGKVYVVATNAADATQTVKVEAGDNQNEVEVELTGLTAGTEYTFNVTVVVESATGETLATSEAYPVNFTTLEAIEPEPVATRNEYAYNLSAEKAGEDSYTITYYVTGAAASAELVLTNVETEETETVDMGAVVEGKNTYTLDASEFPKDNKYTWAVNIHNYPISETLISKVTSVGGGRAGLATFTDPEYPEVYGYTVIGRTSNSGIDVYNPEGELVSSAIYPKTAAMGGTSANTSCPMDATTRGTEVYLASWGDAAYGIVAFDLAAELAEAGSATPYSVFDGTKASSGAVYNSSDELIGSGTPCVGVWGEGEETTLIFFNEDNYGAFTSYANVLAMNVIGNGKTTSNAIQLVGTGYKAELLNTNVGVATVEKGIFASQVRGNGMETSTSGLRYFARTAEGNFVSVWRISDQAEEYPTLLPSSVAGVDVNPAGDKIAVATYTGINVYGLTWEEQDVYTTGDTPELIGTFDIPHLTPELSINYPFGNVTTRTNVRFDAGGNIHAVQQANGYFSITPANTEGAETLTNAPSESTIEGTSAVSNIAVDNEDATPVYYNLNGVRVNGNNLPAGIYVKVVGKKATKVVVK